MWPHPELAPKLGLLGPSFKVPVEDVEMGSHLLAEQRRAHDECKKALEILRLRKHSRSTIVRWLHMEFMQTSNGEDRRALPRE